MRLPSPKARRSIALLIIMALSTVLAACANQTEAASELKLAPMSEMPSDVQNAATLVSDAYRFAVANPEALKNVPCYCGCGAVGHTSNYSCYVTGVKATGEIDFDRHALGCSLCVDIAQDVMRLTRDGKTPADIRSYIDQTYTRYGPSNKPAGE